LELQPVEDADDLLTGRPGVDGRVDAPLADRRLDTSRVVSRMSS
jgi:hypothetical protein